MQYENINKIFIQTYHKKVLPVVTFAAIFLLYAQDHQHQIYKMDLIFPKKKKNSIKYL